MTRLPEAMPKGAGRDAHPKPEVLEIRPQAGPQTAFLSSPADIVIYGGSAGGGKTYGLLMEPLRHIHNPKFGAVIFRRTYPEITNEGAMWDVSQELYTLLGGKSNKQDLTWRFPSGARVSFGHIQHDGDLEKWTGAQIALLMFDQLETFSGRQFFYMLSRNRSTCGIRPYVRATCNPDPESFLATFISWWIADDGYADMDRAGKVRWFVRIGDKTFWADDRESLLEEHPNSMPLSVTFIPASLYDNKILMAEDPGYEAKLMAMDPIERARLLGDRKRGGNWKIKAEAGKLFNRAWFKIVESAPVMDGCFDVRYADFAATAKELKKNDPDFTATTKMRHLPDGRVCILDVTADQDNPAEVEQNWINLVMQEWSISRITKIPYRARWEREGGSAGKMVESTLSKKLKGVDAKAMPVSGKGDKLVRAKPLAAAAYARNVLLVAAPWNEMFLEHMHHQPEWPHDDIMDSASGAFNEPMEGTDGKTKSGKAKVKKASEVFG